jgi:hypothetical protein
MTAEQLREIGRRKDPADIVPLLWEIFRLRARLLRADQLQRGMGDGSMNIILTVFRQELEGEPCIAERAQMLEEPRGPKKGPRISGPQGEE